MPHPYPPDLSDDELLDWARQLSRNTGWGPLQYIEEYERRVTERHTKEMIELTASLRSLTSQIRWLTWLVVGLALAALVLALAKP